MFYAMGVRCQGLGIRAFVTRVAFRGSAACSAEKSKMQVHPGMLMKTMKPRNRMAEISAPSPQVAGEIRGNRSRN